MHLSRRWVAFLLVSVTLKQIIFMAAIPAWQVPDEPAHVAYIQSLIEQRRLPTFSISRMDVTPEMAASMTAIEDVNPARIGRLYPSGFLSTASTGPRRLTDGNTPVRNLAARNSPLFYLFSAPAYIVTYNQSLEVRLLAMRAMALPLLLATVWIAMMCARRLGLSSRTAITIGAIVGWHPAMSAIFSGVNPDTMLILISTWCFYLLISPTTGSIQKRGMFIAIAVGLATSIKPEGWFLAIPAVAWTLWQYRSLSRSDWWKMFFLGSAITTVLGGMWLGIQAFRSPSSLATTEIVSPGLAWQKVLNNDLFERPAITFRTFWGHVGWSGVSGYAPEWIYSVVFILTLLAILGSIIWLIRRRATFDQRRAITVACIAAAALEVFYQYLFWRGGLIAGTTHFPVHGRYYLPLILVFSLWLLLGIRQIIPKKIWWLVHTTVITSTAVATAVLFIKAWSLYRLERLAGF